MTQKAAVRPTTTSPGGKDHTSLSILILDLLDTAWRIAVPVTLFAALGIVIDNTLKSGPVCTLLGTLLGFIVAGILVKKQLTAIARAEKVEEKV